jgi:hypothetical protein
VHFAAREGLVGELVPMHIARATTSALYGELVPAGVAR